MSAELLNVRGLDVSYAGHAIVHDASFTVHSGEAVALIGQSGSGKSTIARSVLRLLPEGGRATGSVVFDGQNLLDLSLRSFRQYRGRQLGFVPQDPQNALTAVRTVGSQAEEAAALIGGVSRVQRKGRILEAFESVGLPDPKRVYDSYPHQLSGGMLQRVLIALAVLPQPRLIVADEPTSALDVTVQKRILDLLTSLQKSLGIGLLLITHDLALAAERADSLIVLKDGAIQEAGPAARVFGAPESTYTRRLQADVPGLNPDRYASVKAARRPLGDSVAGTTPVVDFTAVSKRFTVGDQTTAALDDVSFRIERGRTHALVGESGSGKSTAARILLGLDAPDSGEVGVNGQPVDRRSAGRLRGIRRQLGFVYQNPYTSLDPRFSVERTVGEPLDRYQVGTVGEQRDRVCEVIADVGLDESVLRRRPADLSGGQRQRVAIARALALRPEVIVFDEPTSALDVSVQADIIATLVGLQTERELTYLFISHDLGVVRQFADTVTVLRRGRVVESGTVHDIFERPQQKYTAALIDAVPGRVQKPRAALLHEVVS
ncbi:dipeptide ABC transporter ATP-binding protein [Pseudoclavibacter sp. 13-3]|uniref:dipeptide ABC transporter ATP-binding protein n=1 Tax=Pseudoclavibacter sp. 13-3 TaxID=2901228 RepID=UPI001E40B496|nr:ABC transporter ATP-binding protein [Pseudoclavibacter sp. 13-3]MCD7101429.1 ABC transporter ATP-binding protein [Pseudoclavibacter sp. 13-3]